MQGQHHCFGLGMRGFGQVTPLGKTPHWLPVMLLWALV